MLAARSFSSTFTIVSTRSIACFGSVRIQRSSMDSPAPRRGTSCSSVVTGGLSISAMIDLLSGMPLVEDAPRRLLVLVAGRAERAEEPNHVGVAGPDADRHRTLGAPHDLRLLVAARGGPDDRRQRG